MATTVRELLVKLGVKADDKQVKRFDAALGTVRRTMLAAAAGAAVLTTAILGTVAATARQGDEAAKAGKRIGANAQEMQELGFAAEQSGARMVDVEVALRRQAVAARDAAKGTGLAAESYAKMGVEVTDANGNLKPQIELLELAADGIQGLANDTERMAVVNDIFGRGGAKILPLLKEGAAGIRAYREQARQLGFVLDQDAVKASEDFTDRLNELRKIVAGVRNQVGVGLMPLITNLIERFRDWFIANRAVINQRVDLVVTGITRTVDVLTVAFERVDKAVKEGPGSWGVIFRQIAKVLGAAGIAKVLAALLPVIKAVGVAITSAFSLALANPLTIALAVVVAAILGTLVVIEDLVVFLRGGNSAIGRLLATFERAGPVLEKWGRIVEATKAFVVAFGAAASAALEPLAPVLDLINRAWVVFVESLKTGIDIGILTFILTLEGGLANVADAIELMTLALTDFDAFLAEVLGRVADFAGTVSTLFGAPEGGRGLQSVGLGRSPAPVAAAAAVEAGAGGFGAVFGGLSGLFGPRPALQGGSSVTTVNQEGDTITIPTVATAEEVAEAIERRAAGRRKKAMAAIRGGDR